MVDAVQDPDDDGSGEVGDPFAEGLVEQAFEDLYEVQETTRDSLDEIRRIARRLRPGVLDELGLVSALKAIGTEVSTTTGVSVRCATEADLRPASSSPSGDRHRW